MEIGGDYIVEIQFSSTEDFKVELYVERERSVIFSKKELLKVTTDEGVRFYAVIDSRSLGHGNLMCRAEVYDKEAHLGERIVVLNGSTGLFLGCCACGMGSAFGCHGYSFAFKSVADIPKDINSKIYYGVINKQVTDYKYITEEMINEGVANGNMTCVDVSPLNLTIPVAVGNKLVVLVPYEEGMIVTKSYTLNNDISHDVEFNTQVTGANGDITLYVNDVRYKMYGEFIILGGNKNIIIG